MSDLVVRLVVLGAGGHARAVIDAIQESGAAVAAAVVCDDRTAWGTDIYGVPVRGGDDVIPTLMAEGVTHFVSAIGAIGKWKLRKSIFESAKSAGLLPWTVIHPSARISKHSKIGAGCQIMPGVIVVAGTVVGDNVLLNTGSIVEHDCVVSDHAFLATGAVISGTVIIEEGAHIGSGASILHGLRIGCGAMVGVGSAVVKDVPAGETVVGAPAHPIERK